MSRTPRTLLMAAAAFTILFFGIRPSKVYAWQDGTGFYGHFVRPHANVRVHARPFVSHHRFFHRPFSAHFHRPYRVRRFFVYDPFPRYTYRRVYLAPAYASPYCSPY